MADLKAIQRITKEAFGKLNPLPDQLLEAQLKAGKPTYWIDEDRLAFISYSKVCDEVEIFDLAVLPSAQGQGLGKAMIKALLCQNAGCQIFLEVREDNQRARQLYQQVGFKAYRRRINYYQDGQTAILMEKKA
ncbi:ribosomal protein S18-alanine N-acetyltransferase [Fructobacillus sp. M1-13]|uniref:[Ribosomal protein bS18]-alanine N-acetyltransferase n=1 Tax=Fructobacillus papyriferae TaxID=2713171 RepID=A0ABS5QQW8_9LACO|nr:ribosomal protein S18-alanine N-acetyltransferase [Fructobacillus papyriferae]MBS9335317.1 ribosomal protein S18-alanine N-acetyltransferase [Fructobacillus papyriferae]MCD2159014.1 ribosomal protein S18-alanine N-acetyltransferase [Fructobacillus papyriferae]